MKKTIVALLLAVVMTAAFVAPVCSADYEVLFITAALDNKNDLLLVKRIESLGFKVTLKAHDKFDAAADSKGKSMIYMSESVSSGNIVDKFNSIAVPFVTSEAYILDDMGFTGPTSGTDFNSDKTNRGGKVTIASHPIMKGVSATYEVVTKKDLEVDVCWAIPKPSAVLAVKPTDATKCVVFAYNKGEMSIKAVKDSYAFPEKRAFIGLHSTYDPTVLSEDMWKIFDNAIIWAAGVDPRVKVVETTAPKATAAATTAKASVPAKSAQTADLSVVMYGLAALSAALTGFSVSKKRR